MRFWKQRCGICRRPIDVSLDPMSGDCGGDCWGCIGRIEADMGGSPDDNISIGFVAKEIAWGWREADGWPKPQAFFLAGKPSFIHVRRIHDLPDAPVELWSELNARRQETRKLEIWADGRTGYAFGSGGGAVVMGGTRLSEKPVPSLAEIAANPAFQPKEISRFDFESRWQSVTQRHL